MAAVSPVGRAAALEPLELASDARAAAALYEHHSRRVFAYCLSKLGRREDAEDAVQTTFLHAVRGLHRGVVPSVELAWLLGIARNVCLSRFESSSRRGRLELVCDPADLERSAAPDGRGEELIGLEQALARLPEQQRQAVLLRDWRGLSYEEVAERLGVSLANAETLIFRGRRTLAGLLREEPVATRRRLASLGSLGSLFSPIKAAFTGAAVATKIAAAVTAVAVSGVGVAAGSAAFAPGERTPAPTVVPPPDRPAAPATLRPDAMPAPVAPPTVGPTSEARPPRAAPAVPAAAAEPAGSPAPAEPPAAAPQRPAPEGVPPRRPTGGPSKADTIPARPGTIQSTIDDTLPRLPLLPVPDAVGLPPLPALPLLPEPPAVVDEVVDPVVGVVPPVTVTPPPVLPVPPITIDPPNLLP